MTMHHKAKTTLARRSTAVGTDPECLGPCDPGSSVLLEGIVWNESRNGLLVVNVTWRGKTYVGTLLDASHHHWASPMFRENANFADGSDVTSSMLDTPAPSPPSPVPPSHTATRRLRRCRLNAQDCTSAHSNVTKVTHVRRQATPSQCTALRRHDNKRLDMTSHIDTSKTHTRSRLMTSHSDDDVDFKMYSYAAATKCQRDNETACNVTQTIAIVKPGQQKDSFIVGDDVCNTDSDVINRKVMQTKSSSKCLIAVSDESVKPNCNNDVIIEPCHPDVIAEPCHPGVFTPTSVRLNSAVNHRTPKCDAIRMKSSFCEESDPKKKKKSIEDCMTGRPGREDCVTGRPGREDCVTSRPGREDCVTGRPGREDCVTGRPGSEDCVTGRPADSMDQCCTRWTVTGAMVSVVMETESKDLTSTSDECDVISSTTTRPISDTTRPISDTTRPVSDTTRPISDTTAQITGTQHNIIKCSSIGNKTKSDIAEHNSDVDPRNEIAKHKKGLTLCSSVLLHTRQQHEHQPDTVMCDSPSHSSDTLMCDGSRCSDRHEISSVCQKLIEYSDGKEFSVRTEADTSSVTEKCNMTRSTQQSDMTRSTQQTDVSFQLQSDLLRYSDAEHTSSETDMLRHSGTGHTSSITDVLRYSGTGHTSSVTDVSRHSGTGHTSSAANTQTTRRVKRRTGTLEMTSAVTRSKRPRVCMEASGVVLECNITDVITEPAKTTSRPVSADCDISSIQSRNVGYDDVAEQCNRLHLEDVDTASGTDIK